MSELSIKKNATAALLPPEEILKEIKPLSQNGFVALFQKIWRKWLAFWYVFSDKNPKLAKSIYRLAFFCGFSMGVTVFQYLVTLILPIVFGINLAGQEFLWPKILMYNAGGQDWYFNLLGYAVNYKLDAAGAVTGEVLIGGGLGYFIAFETATFLAMVINFPLQRNITFKSHGNVYIQMMWYFIGWLLTSLFCNGVNSLWLPVVNGAVGFVLPAAVTNIITMLIMGGISLVISFFIFLIIFPDYNAVKKRAKAKCEKLKAKNADPGKLAKAEAALEAATRKAKLSNAEKAKAKTTAQANAKAMAYFAAIEAAEKADKKFIDLEKVNAPTEKIVKAKTEADGIALNISAHQKAASDAIAVKYEIAEEFVKLKKQYEKIDTTQSA